MTDPEPPPGPDGDASGSWFNTFLSSTPRVIGSITALIGAVSGLLIALNKVGILGDGGTTTSKPAQSLFSPMKRPVGSVYFQGTTMYVTVAQPQTPVLLLANQTKQLQDVAMRTVVSWVSGASDYGYSLLCRYRNSRNYYLVGVLSGGRFNIARYRDGALTSLTHGIQQSTYIEDGENDVTVRCVGDDPGEPGARRESDRLGELIDHHDLAALVADCAGPCLLHDSRCAGEDSPEMGGAERSAARERNRRRDERDDRQDGNELEECEAGISPS